MSTVRELTHQEIESLFQENHFAHLGCHADGTTYVVPISYAYHQNAIEGHTTEGLKIAMMRKNPEVCVQVESIQSISQWKSAIAWGRFEELEGIEESQAMQRLIDAMADEFDRAHPDRSPRDVTPDKLAGQRANVVVYRIKLHRKTGRCEE